MDDQQLAYQNRLQERKVYSVDFAVKRYEICKQCDRFNKKFLFCEECKCFMPVKVRLKQVSCPLQKWLRHESET